MEDCSIYLLDAEKKDLNKGSLQRTGSPMQYFIHDTLKQVSSQKWDLWVFVLEDICDIVLGLFDTKIKQLNIWNFNCWYWFLHLNKLKHQSKHHLVPPKTLEIKNWLPYNLPQNWSFLLPNWPSWCCTIPHIWLHPVRNPAVCSVSNWLGQSGERLLKTLSI